jgi:hypothetical protein
MLVEWWVGGVGAVPRLGSGHDGSRHWRAAERAASVAAEQQGEGSEREAGPREGAQPAGAGPAVLHLLVLDDILDGRLVPAAPGLRCEEEEAAEEDGKAGKEK